MYWCRDCKRIVYGYEDTIREYHHEVRDIAGDSPYEEWDVMICENCGSKDIVPAGECVICGEPCNPDDEYCDWCQDEIKSVVNSAMDNIQERFPKIHESVLFDALYSEMERREFA